MTYTKAICTLLSLALGHQAWQRWGTGCPTLLSSYLDDVLCMPLFLALWQWERAYWLDQKRLQTHQILLFCVGVFVLYEFILPQYSTRFTADFWDGAAYLLGALLFWSINQLQSQPAAV